MEQLNNRIELANLPTPVHKMEGMSRDLDGPDIYIKRDDLTGIAFSGNKIRKLEYCCAHALKKGLNVLITTGGLQSNHARATAAAAARLGLKCHLVLGGEKPLIPDGNLFLDRLLGASVTYAGDRGLTETEEMMMDIADKYRERGLHPYIIPLGASDPIGSMGYIRAVREMMEQFNSLEFTPDRIICPTGSAGTLAGLLAGKFLFGLGSEITGFSVAFDSGMVKERVISILENIKKDFFPDMQIAPKEIEVNDLYIGEGYTRTTPEQLSLIKKVAEKEAIIFDPVYTGKAFYGLASEIKKGKLNREEKILFIHTGGAFGLLPYREMINKEIFNV